MKVIELLLIIEKNVSLMMSSCEIVGFIYKEYKNVLCVICDLIE